MYFIICELLVIPKIRSQVLLRTRILNNCTIDNIAYKTGLETDDITSLTCIQIWANKVCYAGDEAPAKEGHLNGRVMLFCVVVQVSNYFLFLYKLFCYHFACTTNTVR